MELSASDHDGISLACRLAPVAAGPRPLREIRPGFRLCGYLSGWNLFEIDGRRFDVSADGGPVVERLLAERVPPRKVWGTA